MHTKRFTPGEAAERAAVLKQKGTADFQQKTFDAAATKCATPLRRPLTPPTHPPPPTDP